MSRARALVACGGLLLVATAAPSAPPELRSDGRRAMGTVLEITLAAPDGSSPEALLDGLFAEVSRLEGIFTNFDDASALSRLNRAAGSGPQPVPAELAEILAVSRSWWEVTGGAFDVTVGPLVALWKEAERAGGAPEPDRLAAARARVGSQRIRVSRSDATAELADAGMSVDLGGIAKGYAIDRLADAVRAAGVESAFVSFGQSSLWALGAPPDAPGWRVLVRDAADGFAGVATLRDRALSVSGSLGQWHVVHGRRRGHVIDPRSGEPLARPLQSAVTAPTAAAAEALSTAVLVLGTRAGIDLLEALPGTEGLLVDAEGARFTTRGWSQAVAFEWFADEAGAGP
ncbi:MAG: FAD:protein FMN transferase [Deltaproteobacteria bacterium]|nr:MAG: FAD:protein FMN transferase [Deltaproteobacteria bacterium]